MRATTSLVVGIAVLAAVATARGEDAAKKAPAQPATTTPAAAKPAPADTTMAAPVPGAKVVLRENLYYYDAFNRRDPFRSLIDGAFNQSDRMELVNLSAVQLVGIVRGEVDRFALLEDASGYSYILRVGDRVHNGSVVSIGEDELVARVTNFGQTTTVRLRLVGR